MFSTKRIYFIALVNLFFIHKFNAQKITYLNGIEENQVCKLNESNSLGTCKKSTDCLTEFEKYKRNESVLVICNFSKNTKNNLICCPQNTLSATKERLNVDSQMSENYEECLSENIQYSRKLPYVEHLMEALVNGTVPFDEKNCLMVLSNCSSCYGKFNDLQERAITNCYKYLNITKLEIGNVVPWADRPNMVLLGWKQDDLKIAYLRGASILTEKFVITSAHSIFWNKNQPDVIRAGSSFINILTKDGISTQSEQILKIKKITSHPDYNPNFYYNDIALIETVERFIFDDFVLPACIGGLNAKQKIKSVENFWTIGGFGLVNEDSKTLAVLDIGVKYVSHEICSKKFEHYLELPNGLHLSHVCVDYNKNNNFAYPKVCQSYSGTSLQFRDFHEEFPKDFNQTLISEVNRLYTILGIMSFGFTHCEQEGPSVFTRLDYYHDWIDSVMQMS